MRVYELIKETYFRRAHIRIVHTSWLLIYALLFLIPFSEEVWSWGPLLFAWSGCLLPLLISAGIFGDDIATGRIGVLITKPMWIASLYVYRTIGLSLQCAVHLVLAGSIIFILHDITGRGSSRNLGLWILATWLLSVTWIALSVALSVLVKRDHNTIILILATIGVFMLVSFLVSFSSEGVLTTVVMKIVKYALPPVELLFLLGNAKHSATQGIGAVLHTLGLTTLYCVCGIVLLSKREFRCERD